MATSSSPAVLQRPTFTTCMSASPGRNCLTTSMVISVEAELSIEAIDTMADAMKAATTRPTRPAGSSFRIKRRIHRIRLRKMWEQQQRTGAGQHDQEQHRKLQQSGEQALPSARDRCSWPTACAARSIDWCTSSKSRAAECRNSKPGHGTPGSPIGRISDSAADRRRSSPRASRRRG